MIRTGRPNAFGHSSSTLALAIAAPALLRIVIGLPNDHYHAFADPMVFTLLGLGVAALIGPRPAAAPVAAGAPTTGRRGVGAIGPIVASLGVVVLLVWNLAHLPPATNPDGGFPAGDAAATRVDTALTAAGVVRTDAIRLQSLPVFKSTEAMVYPLARLGRVYLADVPKGVAPGSLDESEAASLDGFDGLVLLCDERFHEAIGAHCAGAAESTITPEAGGTTWGPLLDRFEAAPDRFVSVYGRAAAAPG